MRWTGFVYEWRKTFKINTNQDTGGFTRKTDYQEQVQNFLTNTKTEFKAEFLKYDIYFEGDKEKRDIYCITLTRGNRSYSFNFGQSLQNSNYQIRLKNTHQVFRVFSREELLGQGCLSKEGKILQRVFNFKFFTLTNNDEIMEPVKPTAYDVLVCLQKYAPGTFADFCADCGYDTDSRTAERIYNAVLDEYKNVCALWNEDELIKLQEIQ